MSCKQSADTMETEHKTVISVPVQEEEFTQNILNNKHICEDHKFKSELQIPIQYNPDKVLEDINSQIEDFSLKLEVNQERKHQPLVSTITVQNKQGSELNRIKPASPTTQNTNENVLNTKFVKLSSQNGENQNGLSISTDFGENIVPSPNDSNIPEVINNTTTQNNNSSNLEESSNISPKHKNLLLMKSFSQNSILPAKSDKIRFPVLGTAILNADKKLNNGNIKSDSAYFSSENIDFEPGTEKRNSVTFSKENPTLIEENIQSIPAESPRLRHVLTQTSLEAPSIPASRPGCAESGVLRPRVPASRNGSAESVSGIGKEQNKSSGIGSENGGVYMSSMEQENLRERVYKKLLRDVGQIVNKEEKYNKDVFHEIMQSKEFLDLLFKLFDQDRDNLLQQETWIEFLKERLSDEKQVDFAEQVESVAYVLCGDGPVTPDLFQQIFHAKGIVDKLFRLLDRDNTGSLAPQQVMDFVSTITNTRPRAGFDKKSLESLEQLFRQTVGNEKEIRREDFQKIVISKNPFFTERVFQIFDKDDSGSISLQEFLDAMHQFAGQSPDDKIKFLFKIYDIDGDGLIQHRELQHVLRACMEENGMQFSDSQLSELTAAMFEDADASRRGAITYEALKHQLEKHGGLLENLSISIDRWLVPPAPQKKTTSLTGKLKSLRPYQLTTPYLRNNYVYLAFLAGFIAINIGLFVSRGVEYANKGENGFVIVARACGQCLNFNCMFILVLMLRQCITFLRTRGFSSVLPLDHHIYLHKLTGMVVAALSLIHTISHLANFSVIVVNHPEINSANYTLTEWLLTARPGKFGLVPGWANPTGIILVFILTIMVICSQAFVRRGGCFEVFYWTHLLYIPFWVLLLLHGPNFWKWFCLPGGIYLLERVLRLVWMRSARGNTYISSGLLLPSRVTHLVIKRPIHFVFHPGDYVFVNIPAIAKYEWHPFTVSSAPEQEDYMWLHIRAVGEWTNRLYSYFEREQDRLHNGEIPPLGTPQSATPPQSVPPVPVITPVSPLQRLHATIQRRFSQRTTRDVQLVAYTSRTTNPQVVGSAEDVHKEEDKIKKLEKSLSMPDIQTKAKKRERLLVLREYMRSESERSFDECQVRRGRLQSLGLAYLSPQNKSLAQSFRYLRHKPTIIAFKTPSLENCDRGASSSSLGSVGGVGSVGSFPASPERQAEEGRVASSPDSAVSAQQPKPVNYPVGKPLEPIPEDRSVIMDLGDYSETLVSVDGILGRGTEIYLDGPYGAPSSHIFRAQHAVLIATGIGVTPFASILQSIMHRYWKARHQCPGCGHSWSSSIPATVMHLRKVDFFWINRDQRSFEWFVHLLSQLEMEQAELGAACERFLEMHMYITSALQRTDMKAVGLQLALDLLHEKEKRDLITGLKTRTNAGRPNWDKVFRQLQEQRRGKVTVFYCGPPQLARLLRVKCDQHGFHFRKETF